MSRKHPGKRPSDRRDESPSWHDWLLYTTMRMVSKMRGPFELDDDSVGRQMIAAARLALTDTDIASAIESGDEDVAPTALALRSMLDHYGVKRTDAIAAETFMRIVQLVLEQMPVDWTTKVRRETGYAADNLRGEPGRNVPGIRREITGCARRAISDGPVSEDEMIKTMRVPASRSNPEGMVPLISITGVYRMIVEGERLDGGDPATVERFMGVVNSTLDERLGRF
jgi:hypothetical protein